GPREALEAVGQLPDVEIDIAGAALLLARIDAPDSDWRAVGRHLSELAREAVELARELPEPDLAARAGALAGLITGRHKYRGDTETYDDPANANLIRVVERRRGLPVALGVIWLHCTRAIGWGAHGIDFPGHFLLALEAVPAGRRHQQPTSQQVVLDVFAGGVPLEAKDLRTLLKHVAGPSVELRPGVLQPMSARRVLLRLQENVRVRRLRHEDMAGALRCTEDMLRIAPDSAQLWREAAVMNQRLDQVAAALKCYARFLDLVPNGEAAARTRAAMDELRARLN
ncbi:MAG: transglutaminase family protein, partial [Acetobacteraceae bacterium]|nr:transglutaminase family protein [Acetobacteraceae bacterium]